MVALNIQGLTPMQLGRLNAVLDKPMRFGGPVTTWRAHIATLNGDKRESDGMADYSRTRFNRMDDRDQDAYIARLKARRVYMVDGWIVPKIIYDTIEAAPEVIQPGDVMCTESDLAHLFGEG